MGNQFARDAQSSRVNQAILRELQQLNQRLDLMARTLDETLAAVQDEGTKEDSLIALVNGIEQQLKDALSGTTIPPAQQAKIDAIFDGLAANSAKVQAAIDANTAPQGGQPSAPSAP